ncbi:23001_t:CDS:10, partial [Entrophospora sp. SA101]
MNRLPRVFGVFKRVQKNSFVTGTIGAAGVTTLMFSNASVYAEEQNPKKLKIYDDEEPEIVLVETSTKLEESIRDTRIKIIKSSKELEKKINNITDKWIEKEKHAEKLLKEVISPDEKLMPNVLYIAVAGLAGTIVARNSNILVRIISPLLFTVSSSYYFLPKTSRNIASKLQEYEKVEDSAIDEEEDIYEDSIIVQPLANSVRSAAHSTPLPRFRSQKNYTVIHSKPFSIRLTTTILNPVFTSIAKKTPRFWRIWFNIGAFVGICVMIIGVGVIMVASWKLLIELFSNVVLDTDISSTSTKLFVNSSTTDGSNIRLRKRGLEDYNNNNLLEKKDHQVFTPVIPGITLPISHLAYYLIALLVCGMIHEAGHAISAINESLHIKSTGIFLYVLYPGAFVNLPLRTIKTLSPIRQLRIICAGVWHNAIIFLLGTLLLNIGVIKILSSATAWKSVDGIGVNVVEVEKDTPLHNFLMPSSLITKLDDYDLNYPSLESWTNYLLNNDKIEINNNGFCASEKDVTNSLDCCEISFEHPYGNSKNDSISCFKKKDLHPLKLVCLPTRPILVNINEQRCTKASDCSTISNSPLCVLPYMPAGFPRPLRIYYRDSPWINQNNDQENVLLYMGDLQVVWEIVGILQSRWSWVPLWIPMSTELIMRYTVSFSLALCVLNILPAIQLDGHYALTAILYWLFNINKDNDDRDDLSFYITSTSTDSKRKLLRIENLI